MAAGIKISALPAATALSGAEIIPVVQAGVTRGANIADIADILPAVVTDRFNVKDFGAVGDGVHDDLPAFNAAIAAIVAQFTADIGSGITAHGGGTVFVPPGIYKVSNTLLIEANNIRLEGCGSGYTQQGIPTTRGAAASRIMWGGSATPPADTAVVHFRTQPGAYPMVGGGMTGIMVDGMAQCPVGIRLTSRRWMTFTEIVSYACTQDQWLLGVADYAMASVPGDTQQNVFTNCQASTYGGSGWYLTNTARGFRLTGGTSFYTGNSCLNKFIGCHAYMSKGTSYYLENTDDNYFYGCIGGAAFRPVGEYDMILGSADQDTGTRGGSTRFTHIIGGGIKTLCKASQTGGGSSFDNIFIMNVGVGMAAEIMGIPTFEKGAGGADDATGTVISGRSIYMTGGITTNTPQVLQANDESVNPNPYLYLRKTSTTTSVGKGIGKIQWQASTTEGTNNYGAGWIGVQVMDPATATYTTRLSFAARNSGVNELQAVLQLQNGVVVPDGSAINYMGLGTINLNQGYYVSAFPIIDANRHIHLRGYTVATLPTPTTVGEMVFVSNGTANKRLAVSDSGGVWRWPDGAIVS